MKLNFVLSSQVNDEFRKMVYLKKGLHKGVISEAIEEAIILWINSEGKMTKKK